MGCYVCCKVVFGKDFLHVHYIFLHTLHAALLPKKHTHFVLQAFLRLTEMWDGKVAPLINYDYDSLAHIYLSLGQPKWWFSKRIPSKMV